MYVRTYIYANCPNILQRKGCWCGSGYLPTCAVHTDVSEPACMRAHLKHEVPFCPTCSPPSPLIPIIAPPPVNCCPILSSPLQQKRARWVTPCTVSATLSNQPPWPCCLRPHVLYALSSALALSGTCKQRWMNSMKMLKKNSKNTIQWGVEWCRIEMAVETCLKWYVALINLFV